MSIENEKSKIWKNIGPLLLLCLCGSFIYTLPYFRYYYYDAFVKYFQLNNDQVGNLGSVYGIFAMISYVFGGFLADRISARKLLSFSLVVTGLTGFYVATYPSYGGLMAVFCVWGVTTILTFWPALIKAVKMLGSTTEQSKAFGFMESGRGISNMILMSVIALMFGTLTTKYNDKVGLTWVILVYSGLTTLAGIGAFIFIKDNPNEVTTKFDWAATKTVLKMPQTWLIVLIMFCSYQMNMSFYIFTPLATSVYGVSATVGAFLGIAAQYSRPLTCFAAGFIGDRINASKVIVIGFVLMLLGLAGVIILPPSVAMFAVLVVFCVFTYVAMYAIQSMHYALLEEGRYPLNVTGTAVGIVATLGYLPEVISPKIAGVILDAYPGMAGFRIFFTVVAAIAAVGLLITLVWMRMTKERRAELIEARKKSAAAVSTEKALDPA